MAISERLFVYGAWCSSGALGRVMAAYVNEIQDGYVLGEAYRTCVGYPVYVAQGGDLIPGQLVTVQGPDILSCILNEFHGLQPMNPQASLFQKIERLIFSAKGEELGVAQVFAVAPGQEELKWARILGGDWRRNLAASPALPERMSERQKTYIRRLGRSTGREIIPIDLDLYRELMKLELIVDRGRRLALSALGRDLLKYLND